MVETDNPLEDARKYLVDYTEAYRNDAAAERDLNLLLKPLNLWEALRGSQSDHPGLAGACPEAAGPHRRTREELIHPRKRGSTEPFFFFI